MSFTSHGTQIITAYGSHIVHNPVDNDSIRILKIFGNLHYAKSTLFFANSLLCVIGYREGSAKSMRFW